MFRDQEALSVLDQLVSLFHSHGWWSGFASHVNDMRLGSDIEHGSNLVFREQKR